MLEFLLALLTAGTVGVLLVPLLRAKLKATDRLQGDLAIYRDQLAEVERERASGNLSPTDAEAARTEIERRILAAADKDSASAEKPDDAPDVPWHRFLPPALCLLVPAFALGLYLRIGQPGVASAPFVPHPTAPAGAPRDQGPSLDQQIAAARERLRQTPDDPETLSVLGELLVQQAQGVVPQPAVDLFRRALDRQPGDPRALFYLGLHEAQAGDAKAALTRWLDLEARSPEGAPWLGMLRAEIERVAKQANIDPGSIRPDRVPAPARSAGGGKPPAASGMPQPTPEEREAMAKMTPEERQRAIRGMVDRLDAKLRASPGDRPEDREAWLRLANARRVLGEPAKAAEAYARADALKPLEPTELADWAEQEVRQIPPGAPPAPQAVSVLRRLEAAQPDSALALFYLGAASFAQGDKADAARRWKKLLALLPPDAPIRGMLEEKIRQAE